MIQAVADAFDEGARDLDVRGGLLVAHGRSFCAGADFGADGGGLGSALTANLRVTCPEARFSAKLARLGIHQGFGLSVTLPELLGPSRASLVLLTGRR